MSKAARLKDRGFLVLAPIAHRSTAEVPLRFQTSKLLRAPLVHVHVLLLLFGYGI